MKKVMYIVSAVLFVAISGWLINYFYQKSKKNPTIYVVEKPFSTTIVKKTVATGSITPRKEVQVKPSVSGVIEALYVEAGQPVKAGQLIAKVKLVPNLDGLNRDQLTLNTAQNNLETARINYQNSLIEFERNKKLYDQKVISHQEFVRFETDLNVRKEALNAAQRNLGLTQQGAVQRSGGVSNDVYSTVDGIILDVPVKVGSSVIERSNFNEGTTIAAIADMNSLVFEGKIDESEVGKLKEGMVLDLQVGAVEGKTFKAELEYISPKGVNEEGAIKFNIRAKILLKEGDYLRAGYSANADIVLEKKENILALKESWVEFKGDTAYVYVEKEPQVFTKKIVKTGISDGINIEIVSGVEKEAKIRGQEKKNDPKPEEKEKEKEKKQS
ncbi:MAG: efflux RND transporter periplasmic adaptor subunit [Raineya sp.]|jgi:HlyD family secretion protein|nr:efflux RND transporter periplasmic adaptor subunit [Raineya sp.]